MLSACRRKKVINNQPAAEGLITLTKKNFKFHHYEVEC